MWSSPWGLKGVRIAVGVTLGILIAGATFSGIAAVTASAAVAVTVTAPFSPFGDIAGTNDARATPSIVPTWTRTDALRSVSDIAAGGPRALYATGGAARGAGSVLHVARYVDGRRR